MAEHRITIDVRRQDGDVTRLQGTAGLAVSTTIPNSEHRFTHATDTPVVSLRASTDHQQACPACSRLCELIAERKVARQKRGAAKRYVRRVGKAALREAPDA